MRRALTVALLTGAAVLVAATPAWAHSYLVSSTPAEGEVLTALPEQFSVTANETLLDLGSQGVFALQIRDADGRYYGDGCVSVVDATMSASPALGESGDYTMLWQVVSADGHPVSGEIPFSWEAPEGFAPAPALDAAPVCGEQPGSGPPAAPGEAADGSALALGVGIGLAGLVVVAALVGLIVAVARRRRH